MNGKSNIWQGAMAGIFLALASCGAEDPANIATQPVAPSQNDIIAAEEALPADPGLAAIYNRSCRSCHAYADAGAPLTRHTAEWDRRFAVGMDALIANVRTGKGSMQAMGMCLDCSDADFAALILFMAGRAD